MTTQMNAVTQDHFGAPDEVLRIARTERPAPGPTEVLVKVHAAGINPVDVKTSRGEGLSWYYGEPPYTLGWDVSGTVEAVGFGVTTLEVGDEVLGMPNFPRLAGGFAEYVTAPSRHWVRKPAALSHAEAAGLPLAGLTAWQIIVETAEVTAGQRVLVHAAAGGVGHLAVQIAKARGAYVIGTARAAKHDFLRSIGVDQVLDYTARPFEEVVAELDLVVDNIGDPEHQLRSLRTLREGGLLVAVPGGVDPAAAEQARATGRRITDVLVEPDLAGLRGLVELIDRKELRVEIAEQLPLAEVARAFELVGSGRVQGKVVLTLE
ncbi:NADP-dependent oxidoreductase [Kitasatospora sp. NBC_01250]|uniref:NADP-dependent oxidoreductase n=1 Tax=unclassified Kitasatospora TaxID=2633591 RepID=UPI002E148196|nr:MULTISPECIES: NADP-dependent oxidoreductase [unclassified Kitasatospora]WSJ68536.1 NADP-dependent oxidoreductase [Kitasatospora sp. NBC_01302]